MFYGCVCCCGSLLELVVAIPELYYRVFSLEPFVFFFMLFTRSGVFLFHSKFSKGKAILRYLLNDVLIAKRMLTAFTVTASCDFTGGDLPPQQFLPPEIPASQQFGVVTQPSVDVFQNVTGGAAMVVGGVSWALVALVAVLL